MANNLQTVASQTNQSAAYSAVPGLLQTSQSRVLDSVILIGLLSLFMFCVLAFGAVEEWSILGLEAGAVLLFLLWAAGQLSEGVLDLAPNKLYLPMALFGAVIIAQIVFGSSAYFHATRLELWKYLAYGVLVLISNQFFQSPRQLRRFFTAMALFGFGVAVFAIAQHFAGNGKLYWVRTTQWTSFFGSYVDRDHYAGLMEMLAPIPLMMCLDSSRTRIHRTLFGFAGLIMAVTIFLSGSRGGMTSFIVEMAFLAVCLVSVRRSRRAALAVAGFSALVFALVLWLDNGEVSSRIQTLQHPFSKELSGTRFTIAKDSLRMFHDRPLMGWGLGTFPIVYPQYRSFYTNFFIGEAHNDYVQALVETGVTGFLAVIWFIVLLYRAGFRKLLVGCPGLDRSARIAALVGCTGILVHSLFDFNLHIPANAALFYVLCAVATG
jgi:O-antigen ligase